MQAKAMNGRNPQPVAETGSRARRLAAARAVWIALAVLVLAIFFAGVPLSLHLMQTVCAGNDCALQLNPESARALAALGLPLAVYAWSRMVWAVVIILTLLVVATVIFWRQPTHPPNYRINWMTILTSFFLLAFFPIFYTGRMEALVRTEPGWYWPVTFVQALGVWLSVIVFYLFPSGRFVPVQARLMLLPATAYALTLLFFNSWSAVLDGVTPLDKLLQFLFWGFLLVGLAAQVYRYRHVSSPVERQQTKWVLFGMALFVLEDIGLNLGLLIFPSLQQPGLAHLLYTYIGQTLAQSFLLLLVLFLAIAILRYRLWDIDIIIRRSLVYVPLTALMALLFFGSIIALEAALQPLFGGLTDETKSIVLVVSTLLIAALALPLRNRIQAVIDRRFYRRKYDAQKVLEAFAARLQNEIDMNGLAADVTNVIQETLQPASVRVWLVADEHLRGPGARP